jgi:DNA end-binding protein Ku
MRFADEIRKPEDVGLPRKPEVKAADLSRMRKVIKAKSSAKLSVTELEDEYAERVRKLVAKKERKDEDVYELPEELQHDEGDEDAQVIDLVEVLKRSLKTGEGGARKSARKSAKKTTRRKKAS